MSNKIRSQGCAAAAIMCAMVLCIPASANTSVWILSNQAEADIVTGNGQITITLIDKVINPTAVTSNLSAFIFTTSNAPTSESILSGTGYERTITGTGAGQYTESANLVAAGWAISLVSATTTLDVLAAGPAGPPTLFWALLTQATHIRVPTVR